MQHSKPEHPRIGVRHPLVVRFCQFWLFLCCIGALLPLLLFLLTEPVHGDVYNATGGTNSRRYMTLQEDAAPGESWFARIEIRNFQGSDQRTETVATPHGDVVVAYQTSAGISQQSESDADIACVTLLPEKVIALPDCVTVFETETESIYLLLFIGG
jgi:hypothetical protein